MRNNPFVWAALGLCTASAQAAAPTYAAVQPALTKNACLTCHAVDRKLVGPAYQDVAKKYKGQRDEATYLASKIKGGSVGVWGQVAMPPNPGVSDAELKSIVDWLVAGAPAQ